MPFGKPPHSGVTIEYRMPVGKSTAEGVLTFFFRLIIGWMSGIGAVYTALSFMPVNCNRAAAGFTAFICVTFAGACFASRRLRLPTLTAFLLLLTASVIYNLELLKAGFALTANSYFSLIRTGVPVSLPIPEGIEDERLAATAFICTAAAAVSIIIAIGTQWKPSLIIIFAATFPLFEMGMYYGMVPSYPMAIMLIASWIAILSVELSEMYAADSESRVHLMTASSGILTLILVILIFVAAFSFSVSKGYRRPEKLDKLRNDTILYMDDISVEKLSKDARLIKAYLPQKSVGGINGGRLGQTDEIAFSGDEMLRVTLPADSEGVYLKGYTGTEYTGSSWDRTELAKREKLSSFYYALESTGFRPQFSTGNFWQLYEKGAAADTIKVENTGAGAKYLFTPYFSLPDDSVEGIEFVDDEYILAGSDRTYSFNSMDGLRRAALGDTDETLLPMNDLLINNLGGGDYDLIRFNTEHKSYRNIVYKTCLDAGEINARLAYEVFGEEYFADTVPLYTYIADMRKYFADNYTYSLKAGALPKGEDFVRRFMSDSNIGSCTHFASAAVLMFRSTGIPARYAEGFVISDSEIAAAEKNADGTVTVSVPDSNAHAWAEIYIMDYGWIPVEMTPGYSAVQPPSDIPADLPYEDAVLPEETEESSFIAESSVITELQTEQTESAATVMTAEQNDGGELITDGGVDKQITNAPAEGTTPETDRPSADKDNSAAGHPNLIPFAVLAVMLLSAGAASLLLIYRRRYVRSRRRRLMLGSDTNAAVIAIYDYFIRVAALLGYRGKPNGMSYSVYADELAGLDESLEGITSAELIALRMDADFSREGADDRLRRAAAAAVMKLAVYAGETLTPLSRFRYTYIDNLL